MEPDDLLCSRNARSKTPLVERAQWKINQPPSLKRARARLEGSSVTSLDDRSETSMGAIPGVRTRTSIWEGCEDRLDGLLCSRNARPEKALVGRAHVGSPPGRPAHTGGRG